MHVLKKISLCDNYIKNYCTVQLKKNKIKKNIDKLPGSTEKIPFQRTSEASWPCRFGARSTLVMVQLPAALLRALASGSLSTGPESDSSRSLQARINIFF